MATSKVTGLIWPGGVPATWHKVVTRPAGVLGGIRAVDDDVGELAERWKGGDFSFWLIVFITFALSPSLLLLLLLFKFFFHHYILPLSLLLSITIPLPPSRSSSLCLPIPMPAIYGFFFITFSLPPSCYLLLSPSLNLILVPTATTGGRVLFSSRRTFFHREHGKHCFKKVYSKNITHNIPYMYIYHIYHIYHICIYTPNKKLSTPQRPKNLKFSAFDVQKFSGRSARMHFSRNLL